MVENDLALCELMHWSWADLMALPGSVYDVLIDVMRRRLDKADADSE